MTVEYDDYVSADELAAGEEEYSNFSADMEEWYDYHSEELAAMFHAAKDKAAEMGVYVLDLTNDVTFPAFVRMCFENSTGRKPPC